MTDRKWLACLAIGLFSVATTGCLTPYVYRYDECGSDSLSGRYSPTGEFDSQAGGCADCAGSETDCTDCGAMCDQPFGGHTLTGIVKRSVTCNSGCGEIYWGEWINDPPADCDPCSNHGDWIGPRCCPPDMWSKLWSGLHGRRSGECSEIDHGGCDQCASRGMQEEIIETFGPNDLMLESEVETEVEFAPTTLSQRSTDTYYTPHPFSRLKRPTRR